MAHLTPRLSHLLPVPPVIIAGATLSGPTTSAELAAIVLARAERAFGHRSDPARLARYAREAAAAVLDGASPRLHAFLPDLALRGVRDALEREAA